MNNQQRGSEKLLAGCTDLQILSQEELEQVAGAGLLSSPMGVISAVRIGDMTFFPLGVPAVRAVFQNEMAAVKQMDAQ